MARTRLRRVASYARSVLGCRNASEEGASAASLPSVHASSSASAIPSPVGRSGCAASPRYASRATALGHACDQLRLTSLCSTTEVLAASARASRPSSRAPPFPPSPSTPAPVPSAPSASSSLARACAGSRLCPLSAGAVTVQLAPFPEPAGKSRAILPPWVLSGRSGSSLKKVATPCTSIDGASPRHTVFASSMSTSAARGPHGAASRAAERTPSQARTNEARTLTKLPSSSDSPDFWEGAPGLSVRKRSVIFPARRSASLPTPPPVWLPASPASPAKPAGGRASPSSSMPTSSKPE
mmetsp:Transcript_14783/g.37310  ORF Transcript_14783/g.37310 Transcript_14783/m.37310 type:complete len:297 (+) Transcript_14783:342-1232(+)